MLKLKIGQLCCLALRYSRAPMIWLKSMVNALRNVFLDNLLKMVYVQMIVVQNFMSLIVVVLKYPPDLKKVKIVHLSAPLIISVLKIWIAFSDV